MAKVLSGQAPKFQKDDYQKLTTGGGVDDQWTIPDPENRQTQATPAPSPVEVSISSSRIVAFLLIVSGILLALSASTRLLGIELARLDVDFEASVPTLWAVLMIAALAGILAVRTAVAKSRGERWSRWLVVTICVLYVMVDESVSIHEQFIDPVREAFDTGGVLYLAWVIPYGIVTLAIVAFLLPWLWTLDRPLRTGMFVSGALFVGGAIAMEGVGGIVLERDENLKSYLFTVTTTIEEGFEMLGVVWAIRTVLADLVGGRGDAGAALRLRR